MTLTRQPVSGDLVQKHSLPHHHINPIFAEATPALGFWVARVLTNTERTLDFPAPSLPRG